MTVLVDGEFGGELVYFSPHSPFLLAFVLMIITTKMPLPGFTWAWWGSLPFWRL